VYTCCPETQANAILLGSELPLVLTIRNAQMESLRQASRRSFENRAVKRCITRGTPVRGSGTEDSIRRFVQQGIQSALNYGIRSEGQILRFLDMLPAMATNATDALCRPWAMEILTDLELSPGVKLALLEDAIRRGEQAAGKP
jgi:hypothetical protein